MLHQLIGEIYVSLFVNLSCMHQYNQMFNVLLFLHQNSMHHVDFRLDNNVAFYLSEKQKKVEIVKAVFLKVYSNEKKLKQKGTNTLPWRDQKT